jgi:hypothetical protein
MLDGLTSLIESPLVMSDALIAIGFSLAASVAAYFMYQFFYGSNHIGAGVHRTFIIGGPAITTLFLGIQTSIPLSLGLLGALSFVRFRTPIKDPAEIGFLLLLIASSIGAATQNYLLIMALFGVVLASQIVQWLSRNRFSSLGRASLMITVAQPAFKGLEKSLDAFLKSSLSRLELSTMSVTDNRVNLHYQYQKKNGFNALAFSDGLKKVTGQADVELFIG